MNRTALITGASRGIGEAIALKLASLGYRLILTARDEAKLESVAAQCEAMNVDVTTIRADLADEQDILAMFEQVDALDLLINNAGFGIFNPIENTSLTDWRAIQQVNVEGAFVCLREAMKIMKQNGGGRIINMASVVGVKGYPKQAAYGASKHALVGLTKTAIEEGRDDNVRVHAICPGGVATEMATQARPDLTDTAALIQPEDVANAVAYLDSLPMSITIDVLHLRRAASAQTW